MGWSGKERTGGEEERDGDCSFLTSVPMGTGKSAGMPHVIFAESITQKRTQQVRTPCGDFWKRGRGERTGTRT